MITKRSSNPWLVRASEALRKPGRSTTKRVSPAMMELLARLPRSTSEFGTWVPLTPTLKALISRGLVYRLPGPDERYRRTGAGDDRAESGQ